ncbi:hypothetical protein BJ165DRAFT_479846 [Panaeolus papilionaceus]|nr:hypothetical protein BJ165DRAFT_479846 [Panaeolus papilionaceus]
MLQFKYPLSFGAKNGVYCIGFGIPLRQWIVPLFCAACFAVILIFECVLSTIYMSFSLNLTLQLALIPQKQEEDYQEFPVDRSEDVFQSNHLLGVFNAYLSINFAGGVAFFLGPRMA